MVILTKAQFKEQLKDPEIAEIKRNIHLFRKCIRPYNWGVSSHHNKELKCFELRIETWKCVGNEANDFEQIYSKVINIFRRRYSSMVNSRNDLIIVSVPYHYHRPKA